MGLETLSLPVREESQRAAAVLEIGSGSSRVVALASQTLRIAAACSRHSFALVFLPRTVPQGYIVPKWDFLPGSGDAGHPFVRGIWINLCVFNNRPQRAEPSIEQPPPKPPH